MTRGEARFSHVATLAVGVTGLVYGWMRYFAEPEDPFAVVNHPLQPFFLHAHVVAAPLLVFAAGLIWRDHVWKRVRTGFPTRRKSGLGLTGVVFPMIASGYLLQVAESERWRNLWIVVHVAASLLWLAIYAWHQSSRRSALPGERSASSTGN